MFGLLRSLMELPVDVTFGASKATVKAVADVLDVSEESVRRAIEAGGDDLDELIRALEELDLD